MDRTLDEKFIKKQDQTTVLIYLARNSIGRHLAVEFMFQNWKELLARFNSIPFTLNNLVVSLLSSLNTANDLEKINNFIQNGQNDMGMTISSFQEAIEELNTNIRWMNRNFHLIANKLKAF